MTSTSSSNSPLNSREQKKMQTRQAFFNAVLDLCMMGQSFCLNGCVKLPERLAWCRPPFIAILMTWNLLGRCLVEIRRSTVYIA